MTMTLTKSIVEQLRYYFREIMPDKGYVSHQLTQSTMKTLRNLKTYKVLLICTGAHTKYSCVRESAFYYFITHGLQYNTHLFDATILRDMAFGAESSGFSCDDHIAPNTVLIVGNELRNSMNTEMLNAFVIACRNNRKLKTLILYFNGTKQQFISYYNTPEAGALSFQNLMSNIDGLVEGIAYEGQTSKIECVTNPEFSFKEIISSDTVPSPIMTQSISNEEENDINKELLSKVTTPSQKAPPVTNDERFADVSQTTKSVGNKRSTRR